MDKIFAFFVGVALVLLAWMPRASAQTSSSEVVRLASAIHRLKTGEQGNLHWSECGRILSADDTLTRSMEYAKYFFTEHELDPNFSPSLAASLVMQESSFDRCTVSSRTYSDFAARIRASTSHAPTEHDIIRLLSNPGWRAHMGVGPSSVGLAQFMWPGSLATGFGLTSPTQLLNARDSIHMLAVSLHNYRRVCENTRFYSGTHTVNRENGTSSSFRYHVPCLAGYWVQHNSPRSFNYRYYDNVRRWYRERLSVAAFPGRPLEQ